jgi:hypothetical protein
VATAVITLGLLVRVFVVAVFVAYGGQDVAQASASPKPASPTPVPRFDACGGSQEPLKKYLSASPCVFVAGQASIQSTHSGTNVPTVLSHSANGRTTTVSSHAYGYPGILLNIGVKPTSQITILVPSFSQINRAQGGAAAGTSDTEYRYKQLVYSNPKRGLSVGILATYQAPTGSAALKALGPSYEINPLLNIALNTSRSIGENLSFPVTNGPGSQPVSSRRWSFAPQAVTFWRSPGGTLLAVVVQYGFSDNELYLTLNAAQLLSRNFQIQGTYGGNNSPVDYINPVQDIGHASGTAYTRSFTIGINYLIGHSEVPRR